MDNYISFLHFIQAAFVGGAVVGAMCLYAARNDRLRMRRAKGVWIAAEATRVARFRKIADDYGRHYTDPIPPGHYMVFADERYVVFDNFYEAAQEMLRAMDNAVAAVFDSRRHLLCYKQGYFEGFEGHTIWSVPLVPSDIWGRAMVGEGGETA